jgi:HSP20 family protein
MSGSIKTICFRGLINPDFQERALSPFEDLHREMERFFEELGVRRGSTCSWERVWHPRCNIYDCADNITVMVDLAGVKKEALDICADTRTLYLQGEREDTTPALAERCHHLEIAVGHFERVISLPAAIDPDRVTVSYDNGLLEIRLPKAEKMQIKIEES